MNYDLKEEEKRIMDLLNVSLSNIKESMESPIWSYTREFDLGKLDIVRDILEKVIQQIS